MSSNLAPTANLKFSPKRLFGGALSASLPQTYIDTSNLRQIPDNQEVYLEADGFASITFDLLERVTDRSSDEGALLYHLEELLDEERFCFHDMKKVELEGLPGFPTHVGCVSTKPKVNKLGGKDVTVLFVLLVRLERVETDLVITVNVPYRGREFKGLVLEIRASDMDKKLSRGLEILEAIGSSLEIRDWGLFGEG